IQKVIQAVDKELTNREGDHVIEKKKRNHVITCTCRSDRSDRSDPMIPAMTAMTRPLWSLLYL
ncbi:hypothetical protein L249_7066, partial [Ophiocordyceps polyrhachis-furcata BCC 54312]